MSKISELSDGGSLVSSDYLIAVRSGGNVKVRMDQINVDQVDLGDNEFIRLGNSQDLTMVHNATNSIINQAGIGDLLIQKAGTTKASITANGLEFPDNSKAIFGAGSDLQIYHDPSAGSIIQEAGAGSLFVRASTNIQLEGVNGENMAIFNENGAVQLYYDNVEKLATTATGIGVTGNVTADGLTVDGAATIEAATGQLRLQGTTNTNKNISLSYNESGDYGRINCDESGVDQKDLWMTGLNFKFGRNTSSESMRITSAGDVGIGTSAPAKKLSVKSDGGGSQLGIDIHNEGVAAGDDAVISFEAQASREWTMGLDRSSSSFVIAESSTLDSNQRLVIDDSGNVGIGVVPSAWNSSFSALEMRDGGASLMSISGGSYNINNLYFNGANQWIYKTSAPASAYIQGAGTHKWNRFVSGSAGAIATPVTGMTLDDSGNLLVGGTSAYAANAITIASGGIFYASRNGGSPATLRRNSDDGAILTLEKDGTVVGSIGSNAAGGIPVLDISANSSSGIMRMLTSGAERMRIDASGHAIIPAGVTLGTAAGVYAAANTLDDYEEGTWTPAFLNVTSTATSATGSYTKIGRVVFFSVNINLSALDNTDLSGVTISLPFASSGNESLMTMDTSATTLIDNADKSLVLGAYTAGSAMIFTKSTGAFLYTDAQASGVFVASGQFRTA